MGQASLLAVAVLLVASGRGDFAPAGARIDRAWYVEPTQLLVEWHRVERLAPKGGKPYPNTVWRLVLWTLRGRWEPYRVIGSATTQSPIEEVQLADVTGDGHSDLIAHDVEGNHGSGPYRVVSTRRGVPRTILAGYWTETSWHVRRGVLIVIEPRGGQSMCCPEFRAFLTYRWNGRRLVVAHTRLVRQRY
jgi:hypothetical protein